MYSNLGTRKFQPFELSLVLLPSLLFLQTNINLVYGQEQPESNLSDVNSVHKEKPDPFEDGLDPEVFSKLTIPRKTLYGSRWVNENKWRMNVSHAIEIVDVTLIHNNELTLRIEFNLRQMWNANGLQFPKGLFKEHDPPGLFVTADYDVLEYMWSPDSYISTSRASNMNTVGMPLSLVYLFKNMSIIYKVRMFTKVACSSSFQWYPLDIQSCYLVIESYKYHSNIVRYHWTPDNMYRPVVVHSQRLFQYELKKPLLYDAGITARGGRGMKYAFVRLKFTFERKLGNNIIQVYTPTTLVVVLSWFSFWLGLDAIPGRISLLVTCMLTLVTMHSGIKSTIPPVHYITMMDVWLVCCMAFVFSAMCEFVIVKYLHWRQLLKKKLYSIMQQNNVAGGEGESKLPSDSNTTDLPQDKEKSLWDQSQKFNPAKILKSFMAEAVARDSLTRDLEKVSEGKLGQVENGGELGGIVDKIAFPMDGASEDTLKKQKVPVWVKIDRVCRACFPSLFCLFNLIYWPILFYGSTDQDKNTSGGMMN